MCNNIDIIYLPLFKLRLNELLVDPAGVVFLDEPVDVDGLREDGTVRLEFPVLPSSLCTIVVMGGYSEFLL